jgi:hypothetical protein
VAVVIHTAAASTGDMAEVLPRASEDTQWTWNCIDMDGFDACYGILNTPKIPNDPLHALPIAICAAASSFPRHSTNINCMTWMVLMPPTNSLFLLLFNYSLIHN